VNRSVPEAVAVQAEAPAEAPAEGAAARAAGLEGLEPGARAEDAVAQAEPEARGAPVAEEEPEARVEREEPVAQGEQLEAEVRAALAGERAEPGAATTIIRTGIR
jgi:hypothetical protein